MLRVIFGTNHTFSRKSLVEIGNSSDVLIEGIKNLNSQSKILADNLKIDKTNNVTYFATALPYFWYKLELELDSIEETYTAEEIIFLLNEFVKKNIGSMSTFPVLEKAAEKDFEIIPLIIGNRYLQIGIGKESCNVKAAASSEDRAFGFKLQRDKALTNSLMNQLGIPIAPWTIIEDIEEIEDICSNKDLLPSVLKPVGLSQGHGVYPGLQNADDITDKYQAIQKKVKNKPKWQRKIIIQKMVDGEDYRILVVGGKFRLATHRIPAHIIGDGRKAISTLIDESNKEQARNTQLFSHTLKPINIDDNLLETIEEAGYQLSSVPDAGEKVLLRKVASMSQGGMTQDVTSYIHPSFVSACETLANTMMLNVTGIDVICKDISKPFTTENGSIIEVNSMPEAYLNVFPSSGEVYSDEYGNWMLDSLNLSRKVTRTIAIGEDLKISRLSALIERENYGIVIDNKAYVNGTELISFSSKEEAIHALFANKTLQEIVIGFRNLGEALDTGFYFNTFDKVIASSSVQKKIQNTFNHLDFKFEAITP